VHAKLMRAYPEVPDSWYASIYLLSFAVAVVALQVWPTDMPVWALALSVLLSTLYLLPCGFIFAATGQFTSINLLVQIIPGVLLNGRPLANMVCPPYCHRAVYSKMDGSQLTNPRIFFLIFVRIRALTRFSKDTLSRRMPQHSYLPWISSWATTSRSRPVHRSWLSLSLQSSLGSCKSV